MIKNIVQRGFSFYVLFGDAQRDKNANPGPHVIA